MKRVMLALTLVAAAGIVGCGGGETQTVTVERPSTATTTEATATQAPKDDRAAQEKRDGAIALAGRLELDDMPEGWATEEVPDGASKCAGMRSARNTATGRAPSIRFSLSDIEIADHAVYVYPDEASAEEAVAALTSSETKSCSADELADSSDYDETSTKVADVSASPLGDETIVYRITLTGKDEVDLDVDRHLTRFGRAVSLTTLALSSQNSRETLPELAARKVKRAIDRS